MAQHRNIVILGASFGGLGVAHYISKHVLPQLVQSKDAEYQLHIVDSSTHFWWHIGSPRAIASVKAMPHEKCFVPIQAGFEQYGSLKESIVFHHGSATALDTDSRSVTINLAEGGTESLDYYALVLATGIRSPTPLTTLQGEHTISLKALDEVNVQIASAKDIVIAGGGPVGVETAGEIANHVKGKAKVTLLAGSNKLLPVFKASRAQKAQRILEKAGVEVVYGVKSTGAKPSADGKTEISLDNGKSMFADVFIPASGITPNTEFLPAQLKSSKGFVVTNPKSLRVDGAGPRVYAAGDVAGVDNGGVVNMYNTLAVLNNNIAFDLLPTAQAGGRKEKSYAFKPSETQLVPIGPKDGVAAFNGWGLPALLVSLAKGRDYMLPYMPQFTEGERFKKP